MELSDEQLEENSGDLGSLFKPLEERVKNLGEQRAMAEQDERNLSLSAENLRADMKGSKAGLRRDEKRLKRELQKLESRRENLPEGFRPTSLDEDFDPLQSRLRQRLKEERELKEQVSEAQGGLEEVRRNLEALRERREAEGLIHHSDRGSHYTSVEFGSRLREEGLVPSMGSVTDAYDNSMAESFVSTLKRESIHRHSWPSRQTARTAIFEYIEVAIIGQ